MFSGNMVDLVGAMQQEHERLCKRIQLESEARRAVADGFGPNTESRYYAPKLSKKVSSFVKQLGSAHLW